MDNSSDWIWNEVKKYIQSNGKEIVFPSDWDTEISNISYPTRIVEEALMNSHAYTHLYQFSEDQEEVKNLIQKRLTDKNVKIALDNIALCTNATAALHLTLLSLHRKGIKRYLIITPTYYSIIDTLKDLNANQIYYHLQDDNDFQFDFNRLKHILDSQYIDAIIFTDPIYSTGFEVDKTVYKKLVDLCRERRIWIIVDYTLGGIPWYRTIELFEADKINQLLSAEKFVFIDSFTKRFLINGIKHSLVLASKDLIPSIEDLSCQVTGGFCTPQIELIKELFNPEAENELLTILSNNVERTKSTFQLLETALKNTQFKLYNSNSGYFTVAHHTSRTLDNVKIKDVVKRFIYNQQVRILPTTSLSFFEQCKFGFRINLLKDIKQMMPAIIEGITKNID